MATIKSLTGLQFPLARLGGAIVLAVIATTVTGNYRADREREHALASTRMEQVNAALQTIEQDGLWVNEYGAPYAALVRQGTVGDERRLVWAESLKHTAAEIGLPGVQYQLKARETMPHPITEGSNLVVHQSAMVIQTELLHSADLVRLIEGIRNANLALIMPEECEIKRHRTFQGISAVATLTATCTLWWVTLMEREADLGLDDEANYSS